MHGRLLRVDALGHALLRRHAHAQAFVGADRSVRNRRGNQDDLTGRDFNDTGLALDRRASGELEVNQIVIRRARELRFTSGDVFGRDPQALALEDRRPGAIAADRRAAQQVEGPDLRNHSLSHARGADDRAFFALHPDMLPRLPVRHKLADLFTHDFTSNNIYLKNRTQI